MLPVEVVTREMSSGSMSWMFLVLGSQQLMSGNSRCSCQCSQSPQDHQDKNYDRQNHFHGWRDRTDPGFDAPQETPDDCQDDHQVKKRHQEMLKICHCH